MSIALPPNWHTFLADTVREPWYTALLQSVESEYKHETVYPPAEQVFAALEVCPPEAVKVVILGQDPYHGDGQAHGLAFSVPDSLRTPPSLRNIRAEITNDTGTPSQVTNDLTAWSTQGVLLLNTTLTVRASQPLSHQNLGWQKLTDAIIASIAHTHRHVVFMLWGAHAQSKAARIDTTRHCVLKASHPSPLSAYRGFFGCGHFTKANAYLQKHGSAPIVW